MKQAQNVEEVCERAGLTLPQLCTILSKEAMNVKLFCLSDAEHEEYHGLFQTFENARNSSTGAKGAALEKLASFLMEKIAIYKTLRNCRTSTNEIDVLLIKKFELSSVGGEKFPQYMICECKNYKSAVSVTYVGKFYSLLKVSGVKLGLIISDSKISGRSKWSDGRGLCRKVALKDDVYIVNISFDDLKRIDEENVSILKIIDDKINEMKLDIEISYKEHELIGNAGFTAIP